MLPGEGGGDILYGRGSNDLLDGGAGDDTLSGGPGTDELRGGNGADQLDGSGGADKLAGGDGVDIAWYGAWYGLGLVRTGEPGIRVDLASGTGVGGAAEGDRLSGIEGVHGSGGNDHLSGSDQGNRLIGAPRPDILTGRGGADRFGYVSAFDSSATAADRIVDFSRSQGDRIDLAAIDANELMTGDQAFRFIGTGKFTAAGQLRFYKEDGDTIVEANVNDAYAGAEMRIVLDPLVSLRADDFIL